MKIFNLENAPKGKPAAKCECVVIGVWEEWELVHKAVEAYAKAHPKMKRLQQVKQDLGDHLAVF